MLALPPTLGRHQVGRLATALAEAPTAGALILDGRALTTCDAAGAAFLLQLHGRRRVAGGSLRVSGLTAAGRAALAAYPESASAPADAAEPPPPALAAVADGVLAAGAALQAWARLSARLARTLALGPADGRAMAAGSLSAQMYRLGAQGLPVVALITVLVGGTIAVQSAHQLREFGAQLFVADLLGISVVRELGPLITAVVITGRSGAAVAAELANMAVAEELAALRTMGVDEVGYLLVPRALALILTLPLLTLLANVAALGGGLVVAAIALDVPPAAFLERLDLAVSLADLASGLAKSVLFAALIATIAITCGVGARQGAEGVGRATTASVVGGIFAVVGADALLSLLFFHAAG